MTDFVHDSSKALYDALHKPARPRETPRMAAARSLLTKAAPGEERADMLRGLYDQADTVDEVASFMLLAHEIDPSLVDPHAPPPVVEPAPAPAPVTRPKPPMGPYLDDEGRQRDGSGRLIDDDKEN
jgi:hypothetical protein